MLKTFTNISKTHFTNTLILIKIYNRAGAKELLVSCQKAPFKETLDIYYYFISFYKNIKNSFRLFNSSALVKLQV